MPCVPMFVPRKIMDGIMEHASSTYPEECCGFLLGSDGAVQGFIRAKNSAPGSRRNRYLIDPSEIMGAERKASEQGLAVLGYYHSHPDHPAVPSEYDRQHAWPGYSYLIVRVFLGRSVEVRSWRLEEGRFREEAVAIQ